MKQGVFEIVENTALTASVSRLRLAGDATAIQAPGQFVDLALPGRFLRRPFSVCDWDVGSVTVLFEAVGSGTDQLRSLPVGTQLDVLTGLGKGFDTARSGASPLLVGGGTGLSPLYGLARRLLAEGKRPTVILGFNRSADVFYEGEFRSLGLSPIVTTADGSYGLPGFVTEAIDLPHSFFYACGPDAMLRAVSARSHMGGQLSFDARMGCGFGACMGCSRKTLAGAKRVCRDGPVFLKEEILWEA